ncbi:hypothetical protein BJV77DRAFT_1019968 [Russula vinacea]|nr:hypothetical protein BJV77DRAFT_1019968 [Russula vinacea]
MSARWETLFSFSPRISYTLLFLPPGNTFLRPRYCLLSFLCSPLRFPRRSCRISSNSSPNLPLMAIVDGGINGCPNGTEQIRICLQVGKKRGTISVGAAIAKGLGIVRRS